MLTECNRVTYKYGSPRPQSTTFYSPNFPHVYPANVACILYWFIGDANHIVQLRFLEFDLETAAASAAASASHAAVARSSGYVQFSLSEMDMGWVNPCVGFGWVGSIFLFFMGWVVWVQGVCDG